MISPDEAIKLHEKYKTAGFVQSVRMDIEELVKLVVWQENELRLAQNEIELMKLCGICKHWNRTESQCKNAELVKKYGYGNCSDRTDTCRKWELEG